MLLYQKRAFGILCLCDRSQNLNFQPLNSEVAPFYSNVEPLNSKLRPFCSDVEPLNSNNKAQNSECGAFNSNIQILSFNVALQKCKYRAIFYNAAFGDLDFPGLRANRRPIFTTTASKPAPCPPTLAYLYTCNAAA
jgi:hypothetical protein